MSSNVKNQRDRFLAFAFASADMLLEISPEGTILFATGAVQTLTGGKGDKLEGTKWLNLFSAYEQSRMLALQEQSPVGARCGPFLINMNHMRTNRKGILTGIKMPYSRNFYVTISLSNELMEQIAYAPEDEFDDSLYNKTQFIDAAEQVFHFARTTNKEPDVTIFDFGRTQTIPEKNWAEAFGEIAKLLRQQSIDGKAAAEIADGRLSFIHDHSVDVAALKTQMENIIKNKDPSGKGTEISTQTLEAGSDMSAEDANKAFYHAINALSEGKDISKDVKTLGQSLKTLVTENQSKTQKLKSFIDTVNFKFHFQPAVSLKEKELNHYEMLCRFPEGNTDDWIHFAQDAGMSTRLDLAVCDRVINTINRKFGGSRTIFSMNILPTSLDDPEFQEKFNEVLDKEKKLHERLFIEIANAKTIKQVTFTQKYLASIRARGFKIILDSLAANARGIEMLNKIECDIVKLDSSYSALVIDSAHERSMVAHLKKVCDEKKVLLMAKAVENKEQAQGMIDLGIDFAQGLYYGASDTSPVFKPPKD